MAGWHMRDRTSSPRLSAAERRTQDVARLRESLPTVLPRTSKPVLLAVSGPPGSGKSYFCRQLARRHPIAVLESDALRKALVSRPTYSGTEHGRLFQALYLLIDQLLASGVPVLLDATNLKEKDRRHLYRIADGLSVPLLLIRVEAPENVIYHRLEQRASHPDPLDNSDAGLEVYLHMRDQADPIKRDHLVIGTSSDISGAIELLARWVETISGGHE